MHKLLSRQMRRVLGVDVEHAAPLFDELRRLTAEHALSPEAARLLSGLESFMVQVNRAYEQNDRDLALRTRSLDLSSDELLQANERLRSELASRSRAIASLRSTLGGLLRSHPGERPLPADDDLESLSTLVANLVKASEASRQQLQAALAALACSEKRFRSVVESLKEVIFQTDAGGRWTYLNPAWSEITGYTIDESVGAPSLASVPPEDRAHAADYFAALARREVDFVREEVRHRTRDGDDRWLEIFARAEFDEGGSFTGCAGTLNDITERRLALLELQEQLHLVQELFEVVPLPIYLTDTAGRFLHLNRAFADFFAIEREQWAGKTVYDLLPTELAQGHAEKDRELLTAVGQQIYEARVELHDGRRHDTLYHKASLTKADGSIAGLLGAIVDITERKAHEATIASAESRLRQITNSVPVAVYQYQRSRGEHAFHFFSRALAQICGLSAEEAMASPDALFAMIHADDRQMVEASIADSPAGESRWSIDFRLVHCQRGDIVWVHGEAQGTPTASGGTLWNGYLADISAAKKASEELRRAKEGAEAANRAKSEFLANMSHEIRTPMNGVIGMTHLLLEGELSDEQRAGLLIVKDSSDALLTIINDILDFSKIEAGKMVSERCSFDLSRCVGESLKSLALRAHDQGLRLLCDMAPDVPQRLLGDAGRLRQVLLNLLGNAIKFTPQGEVLLRLQRADRQTGSVAMEEGEVCLHFTVVDSGIGIPEAKLAAIFDAFAQADGSVTRKYGGTGLGLTISARLAELLGGRIWVESQVGHGSSFHFTVRCGLDPLAEQPARPDLSRRRILVVDPHPLSRAIVSDTLAGAGAAVSAVASGETALAQLAAAPYSIDLAVLDATATDADVHTIARRLRALPGGESVALLITSAAPWHGDGEAARQLRIAGQLAQPVLADELLQAVHGALDLSPPTIAAGPHRQLPARDIPAMASLNLLLVEDNAINQQLAIRLLQRRGHRVTLVDNGRAAVERLRDERFDLVLMDMMMPIMDGLEATRLIRAAEADAGSPRLPIVAMTANALPGDRERCLAAGMDAYLAKPIDGRQLEDVLRQHAPPVVIGPAPAATAPARVDRGTQGKETATAMRDPDGDGFDYRAALATADQETVELISALFLEHSPRDVARIRAALAGGERRQAALAAASLRGTLAIFGAKPAVRLAWRLEQRSPFAEAPELDALLEQLSIEIDRLQLALQTPAAS